MSPKDFENIIKALLVKGKPGYAEDGLRTIVSLESVAEVLSGYVSGAEVKCDFKYPLGKPWWVNITVKPDPFPVEEIFEEEDRDV